jgi:hypothetical protein
MNFFNGCFLGFVACWLMVGCGPAKSTGEAAAEVLEVVNDAMRAIPVEDFITEAAKNGPFGMSVSVRCPSGTTLQSTLQVTVTSTVVRNGGYVEVDAQNQEIVIVGSCDTDGEGGKAELLGGMTITKTLGVGAEASRAHVEMSVGRKRECEADMDVTFDAATGLASDVSGTFCKRPAENLGLTWFVPGFGGEDLLE